MKRLGCALELCVENRACAIAARTLMAKFDTLLARGGWQEEYLVSKNVVVCLRV